MSNIRDTIANEIEIRNLKEEVKQLESEKKLYTPRVRSLSQKLEKIDNWYSRAQGWITEEQSLELKVILKEK